MAATVAQPAPAGLRPPSEYDRPTRPTPTRLWLITTGLIVIVLALVAVTAASFLEARARADTVTSRARTAAQAGDLYFALADLDAEAARLVLLGSGDYQPGDGVYDGNQLTALIAYNDRTAQVNADLQSLAADGANATSIAAAVTRYRSTADAAIGLNEFPGAPAGQPLAAAIGFYGRAATMMQGNVLPAAAQLRDQTAGEATKAADDAHTWALAGLIGTLVLGVLAVLALVLAQRRMAEMFRRRLIPALLAATAVIAGLVAGAGLGLGATARDANASGSRLATYLQVVVTRADSYDVDGTAVRSVLMPDAFTVKQLDPQVQKVNADLKQLGSAANSAKALWTDEKNGPAADYGNILSAMARSDVAAALPLETGTARGQVAFDFFDYDLRLQALDAQRLADFQAASGGLSADVGPWLFWPWILAGATLLLIGLAVRPRFAEYR